MQRVFTACARGGEGKRFFLIGLKKVMIFTKNPLDGTLSYLLVFFGFFSLQPDIALQASPFRKSKIEACLYLCVFLIDHTASTNFC